jgi:hypothetical protein
MDINKNQFSIKESKDKSLARFFVSYNHNRNNKNNKQKSYQLLSLLKQQNDLLIEIDSSLTTLTTPSEIEPAILSLLKDIKEIGIEYRHQKSEAKSSKGLFGFLNMNKSYTAHRIFAYIPDKVWREELFQSLLPNYGVRYYICKGPVDGIKLLEDLHCGRILDVEQNEQFDFIIYDCSDFGQMGINTAFSKEELQKRLTV